jgi:hypothetical protein
MLYIVQYYEQDVNKQNNIILIFILPDFVVLYRQVVGLSFLLRWKALSLLKL